MLDFRNHELLFAVGIWRAQPHHSIKFCQNRSFRCGDIAIFRIIKMAAAAILDFWNHEILLAIGVQGARRISVPNFVKIGQLVVKILRFFDFSRWRPSAILNLLEAYLDHQQWVFYHSAKFGYDWCSSFYNMNISIFGLFGWKMPIHAPKIGVFGQFDPLNGLQYQPKPRKAHPCMSPRHLSY